MTIPYNLSPIPTVNGCHSGAYFVRSSGVRAVLAYSMKKPQPRRASRFIPTGFMFTSFVSVCLLPSL